MYGTITVKSPSSSNPPHPLNNWQKIREGLRHIADSTGPLESRFSFANCNSSAREVRSILHRTDSRPLISGFPTSDLWLHRPLVTPTTGADGRAGNRKLPCSWR